MTSLLTRVEAALNTLLVMLQGELLGNALLGEHGITLNEYVNRLLADVRATRTAAAAPVPSAPTSSSELAPNTKQPAAAILKTCAELRALMKMATPGKVISEDGSFAYMLLGNDTPIMWQSEDAADRDYTVALRNFAPALLKAAEQNERRGELLKLAAIEVGSEMSADLEDDIAKELP